MTEPLIYDIMNLSREREVVKMTRNDMKKMTIEDKWYKMYTKKAGHRQHKSDKKINVRKFRRANKNLKFFD